MSLIPFLFIAARYFYLLLEERRRKAQAGDLGEEAKQLWLETPLLMSATCDERDDGPEGPEGPEDRGHSEEEGDGISSDKLQGEAEDEEEEEQEEEQEEENPEQEEKKNKKGWSGRE